MKKTTFLFFAIIAFTTVSNAQYYAGGTFGFNSYGYNKDEGNTKSDYPSYMLSPYIGYQYSEQFSFGGIFSYSGNSQILKKSDTDSKAKQKFTHGELGAFARYTLLSHNQFKVHAQASLSVGLGGNKSIIDGKSEKGASISTVKLGVKPYLTYSISNKLNIEASLNMLDFGVLLLNTKSELDSSDERIEKHHHFYWADSGCGHLPYNSLISLGITYNIGSIVGVQK